MYTELTNTMWQVISELMSYDELLCFVGTYDREHVSMEPPFPCRNVLIEHTCRIIRRRHSELWGELLTPHRK